MKAPGFMFYPGDWLRDQVAGCSVAAQGLWLRMMFIMHDSDRYGYLIQDGRPLAEDHVAQRCGCTLDQYRSLLAELDSVGVPSRTSEGVIYSRRMVADATKRRKAQRHGKLGGSPYIPRRVNPPVKGGVNPTRKRKRRRKEEGGTGETEPELPKVLETGAFREAWADWLSYRRQRRLPDYVPRGKQMLWAHLAKYGVGAAIAAIEESITQNWQGLFPQRQAPKTPSESSESSHARIDRLKAKGLLDGD